MNTLRVFSIAVISCCSAFTADAVVITAPSMPPPFPLPPKNPSNSNDGSMQAGQTPGGSSTTMTAGTSPNRASGGAPTSAPGSSPVISMAPTKTPETTVPAPAAIVPTSHIELFNGKDLLGWQFITSNGADAKQTWSVEEGLMKCTGRPTGYARTGQAYKDYKVTVEWRFPPGKQGNTGVLVHVTPPETMNPWPKCVECQGMHDRQGDFWLWNGTTCKELTSLTPDLIQGRNHNGIKRAAPDAENPVGEWNTFSVVCVGDSVTIFVNDKEVNKITGCNLDSGYIGLQSEGAGMEIRRVALDPAPMDEPTPPAAPAIPSKPGA